MPIIDNSPQNTEGWFIARAGKISASEISKILTPKKLEPSKSNHDYIMEKAMERIVSNSDFTPTTFGLRRGSDLEDVIRDKYAELNNIRIDKIGFAYIDGENYGCSVDGVHYGTFGDIEQTYEIKRVKYSSFALIALENKPLGSHNLQMQFQMLVMGTEKVIYIAMNEQAGLISLEIKRDEEIIDKIREAIRFTNEKIEVTKQKLLNSNVTFFNESERIVYEGWYQ